MLDFHLQWLKIAGCYRICVIIYKQDRFPLNPAGREIIFIYYEDKSTQYRPLRSSMVGQALLRTSFLFNLD